MLIGFGGVAEISPLLDAELEAVPPVVPPLGVDGVVLEELGGGVLGASAGGGGGGVDGAAPFVDGAVPLGVVSLVDGAAPPVPFVGGSDVFGIPASPGVVVGGVRGFASVGIGGGSGRVCAVVPVETPTRSAITALVTYVVRNTLRLPSLDVSS